LPGLPALFGWHGDHCLAHAEHPHLCLAHHHAALTPPLVALLVLTGAAALVALVRVSAQIARARSRCAALELAAAGSPSPGVRLVRSARPFSLAAGLLRPRIWISTALAEALTWPQLEVVIEHERGHVRCRDALRRWIAAACALPLLPTVRRAVLAELALASEQACDEAAGARVGDRLIVAETILAVERLLGSVPPAEPVGMLAFGGSTVPERVHSLLAEPAAAISARYAMLAVAAVALAAGLGVERLHHMTEHLLGALLRAL
jgi:hypothetical protein